jgi:hypothetical protein
MRLPKYVRIQGRETAWITKKPIGIFGLCWRRVKDNTFSEEDKVKFSKAENWFNENLPHPPFYGENNDNADANINGAITYFKTDMLPKMFENLSPIFELLDKHQIPYDVVYTNFAGKIIYEDDFQVGVADNTCAKTNAPTDRS